MAILFVPFLFLLAVPVTAQQWTATTRQPDGGYSGHAWACWSNFVYQTGGMANGIGNGGSNVYYAHVNGDGSLGSWQRGTALPKVVYGHASVAASGFLYVIGGEADASLATAYVAKINSDGSPGSWRATASLPQGTVFPGAAVWNDRIYVAGGTYVEKQTITNTVYSANIQSDGSLSAWTAQPPLPIKLYSSGVAANGYLYSVGGGTLFPFTTNNVYYTKINADGSLGAWAQTTTMPVPLTYFNAVAAGGRIFFLGGVSRSTVDYKNVFYSAQVAGDGSLGNWTAGPNLPQSIDLHGTAVSDSYIFTGGGHVGSGGTNGAVFSIPLPPTPSSPLLAPLPQSTNGSFQLQLSSGTNIGFGIRASADLVNWTNIGWGFSDTNGLLTFADTNAGNFSNRFYHAYWPLP